ncbi:hypothetical protein Prudu_1118S000300 [Prunus dulcis]|uniref:Uncharacterized protein n=1 Tax=Prunus dulcis TaxID=3755 RepID=A0A4Y1RVS4_PRUDU|nr:hypothetical protein Prudu_019903 [Prunus dulcis]BBN69708.1 hypothetical protein Prudu_1118S000300 [Prunus dulcis]
MAKVGELLCRKRMSDSFNTKVDCKQCGKYSWGGCGKHLATLYASIDEGKHCMCRSWPGVAIPKQGTPTPQQSVASASGK